MKMMKFYWWARITWMSLSFSLCLDNNKDVAQTNVDA